MTQPPDLGLELVLAELRRLAPDSEAVFGGAVRRAVDEVLDGPRTGRWDFDALEKTEKTYVGTKIEIVTRTALGLERGPRLDLEIAGEDVDVKWSMKSVWEIPSEAVGALCLCIGGVRSLTHFQVGLVRCDNDLLSVGMNKDGKRRLTPAGRAAVHVLVPPTPLAPNFVACMDPAVRAEVMDGATVQERITRLFRLLPLTPIPRNAVRTVARTEGDPMRRLRADAHAGDPLEGMKVLSAKYGNGVVEALGLPRLGRDEFMSVPARDIQRLPLRVRRRLGLD